MAKWISYTKTPNSVVDPSGAYPNWAVQTSYDNAEFNLATGQSDYDVSAGQSNAFSNVTTARYISIRTDNEITVKCNSASNNSITVTSSDSPLIIDTLEVTNIYITNGSGSTAAIKIFLT